MRCLRFLQKLSLTKFLKNNMTQRHLLPLEELLKERSKIKDAFPQMEVDYFDRYISILNELELKVYNKIDAGLSANSGLTDGLPGYYTAHDKNHFNEVIRYAGNLLGVTRGDLSGFDKLSPYEIYILLVAIRVHDAGNIYGREGHERGCYRILTEAINAPGELAEKREIAKIARAHGGRLDNKSKDTIAALDPSFEFINTTFRPRLIASIVRFADEVCETSNRAADILLSSGSLPHHSEIYHAYAKSIASATVKTNPHSIHLTFQVNLESISKRWGCENRTIDGIKTNSSLLIPEILDRLDKMDCERRYCNRFSRDIYSVESIRAKIQVVADDHDTTIIDQIPIPILEDSGYPDSNKAPLREQLKNYCDITYSSTLTSRGGEN